MDSQEIREKIEEFIEKHTQKAIDYMLYITPQHEGDLLRADFMFTWDMAKVYPKNFIGCKDNIIFIRNTDAIAYLDKLVPLMLVNSIDGYTVTTLLPTTFMIWNDNDGL